MVLVKVPEPEVVQATVVAEPPSVAVRLTEAPAQMVWFAPAFTVGGLEQEQGMMLTVYGYQNDKFQL